MSVAARTRQAGCHWLVAHTAAAAASATAAIVDGDTQCVMPVHCRWSTERVGFKRAASPSQQSHWQQSLRSGSRMGGAALSVPVAFPADAAVTLCPQMLCRF